MTRARLIPVMLLLTVLFAGLLYWKSDRIFGPFAFREPRAFPCDERRVLYGFSGVIGDELGSRLARIGDVDRDGLNDLAIGG